MLGFCDSELNNEVPHGVYNWTEVEVEDQNSITCFYENQNEPNSTATVVRMCGGHRAWMSYIPGNCISKITFRFQNISQVYYLCIKLF